MTGITELGYVRIGVSDMDEWHDYATNMLGLEVFEENGRVFCRQDLWHHRMEIIPNGSDDVEALGFRVAGHDEFDEMQHTLKAAGVDFTVASRDEAVEQYVLEMLRLEDPSGNPLEIFHGPQVDTHRPFHPGRGMYGKFVTGVGGMGHAIIGSRDTRESYEFYRMLGMRGSIEARVPPDFPMPLPDAYFMHCDFPGSRDHTVAFGPPPPAGKRINHLMFEVEQIDDVLLAIDLIAASKYEVTMTPGRHSNDRQFSFYFLNPSGWIIEIGADSRPSTYQSEYVIKDTLGHTITEHYPKPH
jgi:2,3-dihydroxyethylbenzene 1,2-dioxygenase